LKILSRRKNITTLVLTQKEIFEGISPLGDKNKVARNQTKYYFGEKKNPKLPYVKEKKDVIANLDHSF
jgi:hypothetical protein